ncbi:response regulator, partial [Hydrotalea sp.]|uniref:response regulator transcription factor n=1 Tax=Hydrotalea sp. TaxID=2881279 RepID=UPI00263A1E3A
MAHSIAFAIVDDNSRDLQRLCHSVEAINGCTVIYSHTSPNQFFQQLVSTHQLPDVVITDCQMPEIDGMGLTRLLQLWHPEIKIIVASGLLTEPDVAELMDIGASAIIAKGLLYTGNLPKAMEAIAHQQIFIDP